LQVKGIFLLLAHEPLLSLAPSSAPSSVRKWFPIQKEDGHFSNDFDIEIKFSAMHSINMSRKARAKKVFSTNPIRQHDLSHAKLEQELVLFDERLQNPSA
jgi:hypothetical protein